VRRAASVLALLPALLFAAVPAARADNNTPGFKISTWNLDWLTRRPQGDPALPPEVAPRTADDLSRLAGYAARLHPDVAAIEEVDGPEIAALLFPSDRYRVEMTNDQVAQRVGLAVARTIGVERHPDLSALDVAAGDPRSGIHHLRSGLDATLLLPGGFRLRVLAVHLKSGCWDAALSSSGRPACRQLKQQLGVLQNWVRERRAANEPFLLLGDFNRRLKLGDPFLVALQDAAPVASATAGRASPCWGGEDFIDQIVAGDAARAWLDPASLRVMVYKEDVSQRDRLSDHCPTSVMLRPIPAG
jgi:endonuclease/exonuclease/phosphatase family metal-dependent hydrolase